MLDKIIADYTKYHSPFETHDGNGNRVTDYWLADTLRRLEERYDGGVSPTVNKLRIEAARKVAMDLGTISVTLYAADGVPVFFRRFQTRQEAAEWMEQTYTKYDALAAENAFARAVFIRVNTRGVTSTRFGRGDNGWITVPETPRMPEV